MTRIEVAKKAEKFYDDHVSKDIDTGHTKKIFTNGQDCLLVEMDDPCLLAIGEAVYNVRRLKGKTVVIEVGYNF